MMRLYDTRRRCVVPFEPSFDSPVKIYTCGITPYDAAHLGHVTTYLVYDVLQRRLRDLGHDTQCVRNVTDIDEPLFERARSLDIGWKELGDRETKRFQETMDAMRMLPAFSEPRATESVADVLGFIGMVLDAGYAYQSGDSIYFDVKAWPEFGQVSNLSRDAMLLLASERGGHVDDPNKRDPLDFVLWQPSAPDEPVWQSMWGPGRPGWHIECSALALRELGVTIDLHGGGEDLIFPHHECESAQSEAATGQPFVRHWMHVALVGMDGEKMSKSLGNLVFVDDLLHDWEPDVVRIAVLSHHYRTSWEWSTDLMPNAMARLEKWRLADAGSDGTEVLEAVRAALDEDLDTPTALELIDEAAARGQSVALAARLLGVEL